MNIDSQNAKVLEHLRAGNSLTHLDALRMFGIARLAARANDLRNMLATRGAPEQIVTDMVREGGKRFARYRMVNNA